MPSSVEGLRLVVKIFEVPEWRRLASTLCSAMRNFQGTTGPLLRLPLPNCGRLLRFCPARTDPTGPTGPHGDDDAMTLPPASSPPARVAVIGRASARADG